MDAETTKLVREALESAIYWTSTGAPSRAVGGAMILEGLRKALDVLPTEPSDDLAKLAERLVREMTETVQGEPRSVRS